MGPENAGKRGQRMARILDVGTRPEPVRPPERADLPAPAVRETIPAIEIDEEDSSIPFIEVGAPANKPSARPEAQPVPTILPLNRPEPKAVEPSNLPALFRVSFRALPYVPPPTKAASQRFPKELVSWHHPEHEISGQYRSILHEIEDQLGVKPGKVLLFTAAAAGAGTTSVLLNLALTCARREHERVAVLDANFSAPALAARLGVSPSPGMREVLNRSLPLAWALQDTGVANVSVLTSGEKGGPVSFDLWSNIVKQLQQRFDWIFVDTAAWLEGAHLAEIASPCTAAYLVLRPNDFEAPHLDDMLNSVAQGGSRIRGYILAQP